MRDNENTMPMVWNEPGSGDKNKNPWGNKRGNDSDGPPDLDQVFQDIKRRIRGLFGKGSNGGASNTPSSPPMKPEAWLVIGLGIAVVLYFVCGFYTVASYEQAVITRFGKYDRTVNSGLHWMPIFFDK